MAQFATLDRYSTRRGLVSAGIVSGMIGGAAMAMLAMFVALAMGQGFWTPMYLIAGVFWGVNTLVAGPGSAVVGFLIHMTVSAMYGVIFALLTRRQASAGAAFIGGLAYGFAVWAFMSYLILPWSNPTMNARVAMMPGWWFLEHLMFGAMLFLTPILARAFSRGQVPTEEQPRIRRAA